MVMRRALSRLGMSGQPRLRGFFGHHKCGSTWVLHVLSGLADAAGVRHMYSNGPHDFPDDDPVSTVRRRSAQLLFHVNANHAYLSQGGAVVEGVHVVRDPRDLLVSALYSHLHSHRADDWPDLQAFRAVLAEVPKGVGLLLELEFCHDVLEDLRSWPAHDPNLLLVRFEDLVADPLAGFREMAARLDLLARAPAGTLERLVEQFSFEQLSSGRKPGQEDPGHHYRKGVPGDWKTHFGPEHRWLFAQRHDDLLSRYGYAW